MEGGTPPKPPIQREDKDLSQDPKYAIRQGTSPPRLGTGEYTDVRSPAEMMRQMGFDPCGYMTPLQFLCAVFNDDLDLVFKNEKRKARVAGKGGIALGYRVECAKVAAKYLHMEMPKVEIQKGHDSSFGNELVAAGERIRTKRVILETVERISPDIPLQPASYPPAFVEGRIIEAEALPADAEGDTEYDPDNE